MASLTNMKERKTVSKRRKKQLGCDAIVCLVVTNKCDVKMSLWPKKKKSRFLKKDKN